MAYAWGARGKDVVTIGADFFYAEKKDYTPGKPFPADFAAFKAGHYTQMVWRDSTEIGAGKAVVRTGPLKGASVMYCNYDPPGNVIGKTPY
jgi:pathogenesis-related protein 1